MSDPTNPIPSRPVTNIIEAAAPSPSLPQPHLHPDYLMGARSRHHWPTFERFVQQITEEQPESLPVLQRAFARTVQSQWISSHLLAPDEKLSPPWPRPEHLLIEWKDLNTAFGNWQDCYKTLDEVVPYEVDFVRDVVITYPRKPNSTRKTLLRIGQDRSRPWVQDPNNHILDGYLYFNVFFCSDGHHSTTTGILKQEGKMPVTQTIDPTRLLEDVQVSPDGEHYLKARTGETIAPVPSQEFAAIFRLAQARLQCGMTGY